VSVPGEELLRSGATGLPLYRDPAEVHAELRRQQGQCSWDDATPLARDAAAAYREVCGTREQRLVQREPSRGSTFL
jgi:hypothetical protein